MTLVFRESLDSVKTEFGKTWTRISDSVHEHALQMLNDNEWVMS